MGVFNMCIIKLKSLITIIFNHSVILVSKCSIRKLKYSNSSPFSIKNAQHYTKIIFNLRKNLQKINDAEFMNQWTIGA